VDGLVLRQSSDPKLSLKDVILLDSQSTVSVFCNEDFVVDIKKSKSPLILQSNGGSLRLHKTAVFKELGLKVWYSSRAITNILPLAVIQQQYPVTYNRKLGTEFVVHRTQHGLTDMIFWMHLSGLHYYDPVEEGFVFIETVEQNKLAINKHKLKGAEKARSLYAGLGFPSVKDFQRILQSNQLKDCPVTVADLEIALNVWGPNISVLKGKTVRSQPGPVKLDVLQIPTEIRDLQKNITLSIDIFYVNKIPFLVTLSRVLCFVTVMHLVDKKASTVFKILEYVVKYYSEKGFKITGVVGKNEFTPLEEQLVNLPGAPRLNLTSAGEHEPFVE
jgi:hypothetical protein